MAADWIKMRANLAQSPKVVRMASALNADRFRIVGGLHAVWSLFDEHSIDGTLDGYTPKTLDDVVVFPGIAGAMIAVEWLIDSGHSLAMPRFDSHNGASAKRRATEAERKRLERLSALNADKNPTECGPEKRRGEEDIPPHKGEAGDDATPDKPAPTLAGEICRAAMIRRLRGVNLNDPKLLDVIAAGATAADFEAATAAALERHKDSFAYVIATVRGRLDEASAPKPTRPARREAPSAMQGTIDNGEEALALLGFRKPETEATHG